MINYMRTGRQFNIVTNNEIYPYTAETDREAEELNQFLIDVKNGDRTLEELEDKLNPGKKFEREGLIEFKNGRYRIAGTKIPIDETLANHIVEFHSKGENITGLLNFAKLLYLNPYKYNREHLYEFIQRNGVIVTEQGHLVLYKSVRSLNTVDSQLAEFIGNKVTWALETGTDTDDIYIYRNNEDSYFATCLNDDCSCDYDYIDDGPDCIYSQDPDYEYLGTLADLYENGINNNDGVQFTDFHSGSTDIKLGVPVSMPVESCDPDPRQQCSKGLHAGSFSYVETFGFGSKTILVVLINPMNVVAVPYDDKLRASEYFPVATLQQENGHYKRLNTNIWSNDYLPYEAKRLEEIKEEVFSDDDQDYTNESARAQAVTTLLNDRSAD